MNSYDELKNLCNRHIVDELIVRNGGDINGHAVDILMDLIMSMVSLAQVTE